MTTPAGAAMVGPSPSSPHAFPVFVRSWNGRGLVTARWCAVLNLSTRCSSCSWSSLKLGSFLGLALSLIPRVGGRPHCTRGGTQPHTHVRRRWWLWLFFWV